MTPKHEFTKNGKVKRVFAKRISGNEIKKKESVLVCSSPRDLMDSSKGILYESGKTKTVNIHIEMDEMYLLIKQHFTEDQLREYLKIIDESKAKT
jgi:hypothetical protein